jgi:nitroimidazol reductase NimA-like FMN-containing flavoprotein (pyridoxamine 5'-phosphate oxidase superfamily)
MAASDPASIAREVIDSNSYMTLGTADADGLPWVSPVWFATADYRQFLWVSDPERRHSRNLAERPHLSIVIFDSRAPIYEGQAVYMSAVADLPEDSELDRALEMFSDRSEAEGARRWTRADVEGETSLRLYRATASEHFVLGEGDERIPVSL